MSSRRHERVSDLFLRACELEPEARGAFLDDACAGDPELRAEVESLLAHDGEAVLKTGGAVEQAVPALGSHRHEQSFVESEHCSDCGAWIPLEEDDCPACRTRINEGPTSVPGYRILRLLGEGGMGKVYLAEDTTLGRRVAIKTLLETEAASSTVQRFVREARTMATVEHPHIVRLYAFGQIDGRNYLVMEYVDGESLAGRIRRLGRLGVEESLRILGQTVEALEAAWEHGIIHRDVKPANILIDTRDQVRVVDFGLAKVPDSQGDPSITHVGHGLGTPHYISPEQARGERAVDFRTDVYSLGVVLYEMLTGGPPFRGATPISVVDQHLHTPLPSLRSARPDVAGEVEQLCEWMTRKQPADRPGAYGELREIIDALLGRISPVIAGPRSLPFFSAVGEEERAAAVSGPVFVGREHELQSLGRMLDRAQDGQGQVVFVTGEAGSGKTALITEFARQAQDDRADVIVIRGKCDAQTGTGNPYSPFREALGLLTGDVESGLAAGTLTREHARRLWNLLPLAVEALVDDGPDLVGTFVPGAALISRAAAFTPSPAGWRVRLEELARRNAATPRDVNLQQSYLFDQFTRTLQTLAQRQPLLLELEDLQWADAGSCGLLFHLGRHLAGSRILVVGTYRPDEVELERDGQRHPLRSVVNELQRRFGNVQVDMGEQQSREFVDALLDSEPNALGSEFRDALHRHTRGHPLFVVELLRSMREQNMLVRDDENRWIEASTLDWGTLPARVEGAIGERIGRLPEKLQELLRLASVQGEEFIAEVLAKVHGTETGKIVGLLSRELDKRHRLVRARGVRRMNGKRVSTYRFRHILFQKYQYGQMDEVERTYLHEEVGTAMESLYGEHVEELAVQLARHFQEAGVADKAIRHLRQAAGNAVRLSANEEALANLTRALGLLETLPDTPDRARTELSLQLDLGSPLLATAGPGSAELSRAYTRARKLCDQAGEPPQLFQTLFLLVHHHASKGELETTLDLAEQLVNVTKGAEESLPAVMAYWARGFARFYLARFGEARRDHERVVDLYDPQRDVALAYVYGMDPAVSALSFSSHALWFLGHPDQALATSRRALALARQLNHPSSLAHALLLASSLAMLSRDVEALEAESQELLRLSTAKGILLFQAWGVFVQGWLRVEQGQLQDGMTQMRQGMADIEAAGSTLALSFILGKLAEAHARADEEQEGLDVLSRAAELQQRSGLVVEPELQRIEGELLFRQASAEASTKAEQRFRRAIEIARRQSARSWELRATMSLSRLLRTRGGRDEARQMLAEIHGWFTEGFNTPDLKEARELLEELSG